MNIYQIQTQFLSIIDELENGEFSPELEEQLKINEEEFSEKTEAYATVIRKFNSKIKTIDEEIKRLQGLKSKAAKNIDRLKDNISEAMKSRDLEKVQGELFTISFRKSTRIDIVEETLIPEHFFTIKTTRSVSKSLIKDSFKVGEKVPGTELNEYQSLQIK